MSGKRLLRGAIVVPGAIMALLVLEMAVGAVLVWKDQHQLSVPYLAPGSAS